MSDHGQMASSNRSMPDGYLDLLDDVKREITGARLRTALAVNTEMIALYWRIGRLIVDRQPTRAGAPRSWTVSPRT